MIERVRHEQLVARRNAVTAELLEYALDPASDLNRVKAATDRLAAIDHAMGEYRKGFQLMAFVVVAMSVGIVLTALVAIDTPTAEFDLTAQADSIGFETGRSSRWMAISATGSITVRGDVELTPRTALVNEAAGSIEAEVAAPNLWVQSLAMPPGSYVHLDRGKQSLAILVLPAPGADFDAFLLAEPSGTIGFGGASTLPPRSHAFRSAQTFQFAARGGGSILVTAGNLGAPWTTTACDMTAVAFHEYAPPGMPDTVQSSLTGGKLSVVDRKAVAELAPGQSLTLRGLKLLRCELTVDKGLTVRLVGSARSIDLGYPGQVASMKPSSLEYLKSNHVVSLLWGSAVFLWGSIFWIWRLVRR